ncbi:MAG: hypothetical protein ACYDD4_11810 [Acidimicrobiales bacterium]
MMSPVLRRRRMGSAAGRTARCALAVAALAVTAAGCASPRNSLGTSSSPCYQALPVAISAIKSPGTLVGIRLLGQKQLSRLPRLEAVIDTRAGRKVNNVCAVEFHGSFNSAIVEKPFGQAGSKSNRSYAVVLVATPSNKLLGTIVLAHQPLGFRHEI